MGIIKTGITMGAAYAMFNSATKAYGQHEKTKHETRRDQYQPQQMQFQQPTSNRKIVSSGSESQYVHQHFCNGQCAEQCNPNSSADGYAGQAQYYNNSRRQQGYIEQGQQQSPSYYSSNQQQTYIEQDRSANSGNSLRGRKDVEDLASLAQQFMRK